MRFPIAIELRTDHSEYGAIIPDLPGCFSAGDTLEEAIAGAEEAGLAWIDAALDAGNPVPSPSPLEAIRAKPEYAGWILSLVTPSILPRSTTRSSASTSRCRGGSCVGSTRRRARPARRDQAISPS
jgi:predicted RNase H-like HicB family nuclease